MCDKLRNPELSFSNFITKCDQKLDGNHIITEVEYDIDEMIKLNPDEDFSFKGLKKQLKDLDYTCKAKWFK